MAICVQSVSKNEQDCTNSSFSITEFEVDMDTLPNCNQRAILCGFPFHYFVVWQMPWSMPIVQVIASNTCGLNGPETYYRQVQSSDSSAASSYARQLRYTCDDSDPRRQHNTRFLTGTYYLRNTVDTNTNFPKFCLNCTTMQQIYKFTFWYLDNVCIKHILEAEVLISTAK